jgi:hypothetical protein
MIPWVSIIITGFGLVVSIAVLHIQRRNQIERRHGELVALHSQLLSNLSTMNQRQNSQLINAEMMRLELRRLPDLPTKYELVEDFPRILKHIAHAKRETEEFIKEVEQMDLAKFNRTDVLLAFQKHVPGYQQFSVQEQEIDEELLGLLEKMRRMTKD